MQFSDWIKSRLEHLRSMIGVPDGDGSDHEKHFVVETRTEERLIYTFKSNTRNLARVRKAVEGFCDGTDLDLPAREEIGLVVNEAVANVMRHAYDNADDKPIELTAARLNGGIKIQIRDWGPNVVPPPKAPPDPKDMTPGGLGLLCIRKLMDEVKFVPQSDGMILELTRTTPGSLIARAHHDETGPETRAKKTVRTPFMSATKFPTLIKSTRRDGDAAVVVVIGEIDLHNSRDLREVLLGQLEDTTVKKLVLNLCEVPYMDSSALAAMVESLQRISKTGGKVYLTNLQQRVRGLLEVARLNTIFVVVTDEGEALKHA